MNGTGEKVGGGEPFCLVSEVFKPKAVPCESRRVARHINYAFGRHFYDFRQKHFGAAFARRVNNDDIRFGRFAAVCRDEFRNNFFCSTGVDRAFVMPFRRAFSFAFSMASGTISTPITSPSLPSSLAMKREMVPMPQYRSHTVSPGLISANSRAVRYNFSV